jgi:hypothetical protein
MRGYKDFEAYATKSTASMQYIRDKKRISFPLKNDSTHSH